MSDVIIQVHSLKKSFGAGGNLDQQTAADVMQLFHDINEQLNVTILQVTHSEEMASWGKRIIRMLDGMIRSDAPVAP